MVSSSAKSMQSARMPTDVDILIVGAGPTGLGAASRLTMLGHESWIMVESMASAGGLARTARTREGFLFDMGGHVTFTHYDYVDELMEAAKHSAVWNTLPRRAFVYLRDRFVPYPLQNNLACLPRKDRLRCIRGLLDVCFDPRALEPIENFDTWIVNRMGVGIANVFMRPYNFKVWGYPTCEMQAGWIGERVAQVDVGRVMDNVISKNEDSAWGPNNVFKFPKAGGTGSIWQAVADRIIPENKQVYGASLTHLDLQEKLAYLSDGSVIRFKSMINTAPLDIILKQSGFEDLASKLRYSSTHVIGLGIRGTAPHTLAEKSWMYYPEDNCPFYRATVFSSYGRRNCPGECVEIPTIRKANRQLPVDELPSTQGPYWSLLLEVSETRYRTQDQGTILEEAIAGAIKTGLLEGHSEIVSTYYTKLHRGYPTPHVARDAAVETGLALLKSYGIWSRGRFGAWKYEVGNQDHSVMQGVEAVDNILYGLAEKTVFDPNYVNGRRNKELHFELRA
jgi:protoporphyrinogen oxidase